MKLIISKVWEFVSGYDYRLWFPEQWDLSDLIIFKEYGGNKGFVNFYRSSQRRSRFVNGVSVLFYEKSFKVKSITGCTVSGVGLLAINKIEIRKIYEN